MRLSFHYKWRWPKCCIWRALLFYSDDSAVPVHMRPSSQTHSLQSRRRASAVQLPGDVEMEMGGLRDGFSSFARFHLASALCLLIGVDLQRSTQREEAKGTLPKESSADLQLIGDFLQMSYLPPKLPLLVLRVRVRTSSSTLSFPSNLWPWCIVYKSV